MTSLRPAPEVGAPMRLDDDGGHPCPDPAIGGLATLIRRRWTGLRPAILGRTVVVPDLSNRPAGEPLDPATGAHRPSSVGSRRAIDVALKRPPVGRRRVPPRPTPAGRPPERAQLVWGRALELAEPGPQRDRFADALSLLCAAHHDPATMAHALALGRTHLRAQAGDAVACRGASILEAAIAFLGVKPRTGDLARAPR